MVPTAFSAGPRADLTACSNGADRLVLVAFGHHPTSFTCNAHKACVQAEAAACCTAQECNWSVDVTLGRWPPAGRRAA